MCAAAPGTECRTLPRGPRQQRRSERHEPKWCSSAWPRALLFVSFHRSRAASERLTGGGDASAARAVRLRGYEVRAPRHRRRHARRQDPGRGGPRPAAAFGTPRPRERRDLLLGPFSAPLRPSPDSGSGSWPGLASRAPSVCRCLGSREKASVLPE
ncbi:hypothetical protein J1605_002405 [Eschrichtius robustus]|uniref:Uncharacterized protein n=1 Tax=Eschrichtius robustus TaxID=9764 RepID=A0AB34HWZ8_ESCRO|nr:hypothetical protein J1605_002405 [Eschrichtius robustus]